MTRDAGAPPAPGASTAGAGTAEAASWKLPDGVTEAMVTTGPEGLSSAEAAARLARFGPNEVPEDHVSTLRKLLGNLWGPIPWMIEAAAVLAFVGGHLEDFAVIATLLAVTGTFMAPLDWHLADLVWVYALAWFVVNDRVKLLALRFLDRDRRPASQASPA